MSDSKKRGRSTGPKTPEGKAKSSQNSTTHGCTAKTRVIKGEKQAEFDELMDDWMDDYRPRGKSVRLQVETAVEAQWVLKRNMNRYHELEESLQGKKALDWTEEEHKKMERFIRYRTTAERSLGRAANLLEQAVKRRRKRVEEREREREEAEEEKPEPVVEKAPGVMEPKPNSEDPYEGAIHVLDQWADVTVENGRAVTKLEPSNEQLLEDLETMEPRPEQVSRWFTFYDGVPAEEYGWCAGLYEQVQGSPKYGSQQITIEAWLQALEREKAAGTGHLGDAGEDLPDPKRRGWCWCTVCARRHETALRRKQEQQAREKEEKEREKKE